MTDTSATATVAHELPEAAERRLEDGLFSSSLTIGELAALDQLGLEPVDVVQGFCVMHLGFTTQMSTLRQGMTGSGWSESYQCPHGYMMSNEHRTWGMNFEQRRFEDAWTEGFELAHTRLVEEAKEAGAHGVIGVAQSVGTREGIDAREFHLFGTAVRLRGHDAPVLFTTSLAGPRLVKLLQSGLSPVRVVATLAEVHVYAVCTTQYLFGKSAGLGMGAGIGMGMGMSPGTGEEITQWASAETAVRRLARQRLRDTLGTDELHNVTLSSRSEIEGEGDGSLTCFVAGDRVRRVAPFAQQPLPTAVLRLS